MTAEEQMSILRMVQEGTISAAEADRLLQALGAQTDVGEACSMRAPAERLAIGWSAKSWVRYVLVAGSLLTALGATLLAAQYASPHRGSLTFGYIVLGMGLLTVLASVWLGQGAWLRIRIADARSGKEHHHIEIPLPLGLAAWAVSAARPFVRQFDLTGIDEAILALRDEARAGRAITIDVSERDDGEQVQLSLG